MPEDKKPEKLVSSLIRTYVSANKQIEEDLEKERLIKMSNIEKLRKKVEKKGDEKKGEDFAKKTQKIQNLDFHSLEFHKFLTKMNIDDSHLKSGYTSEKADDLTKQFG